MKKSSERKNQKATKKNFSQTLAISIGFAIMCLINNLNAMNGDELPGSVPYARVGSYRIVHEPTATSALVEKKEALAQTQKQLQRVENDHGTLQKAHADLQSKHDDLQDKLDASCWTKLKDALGVVSWKDVGKGLAVGLISTGLPLILKHINDSQIPCTNSSIP